MNRVDSDEVKAIIDTSIAVDPFIATAHLLVDEELLSAGYSEARLTQIELYLAAHFACLKDPRLSKQKFGDGEDTFHMPKTGEGLSATSYGQQVAVLDSKSILSNLQKPKAVMENLRTNVVF